VSEEHPVLPSIIGWDFAEKSFSMLTLGEIDCPLIELESYRRGYMQAFERLRKEWEALTGGKVTS
jgi:hypothetical protein